MPKLDSKNATPEIQGTLFGNGIELKPRSRDSYTCSYCKGKQAVHWDASTVSWRCCQCGRADLARTIYADKH